MNSNVSPVRLDAAQTLLILESGALLATELPETNPLRRMRASDGGPLSLPLILDSRALSEAALARAVPLETTGHATPEFIYVARKGERFDGHSLVERVLGSGNVFIGERRHVVAHLEGQGRPSPWIDTVLDHPFFLDVDSTEAAARRLLEEAFGLRATMFTLLAVTGTNGKTSVTQILGDLLCDVVGSAPLRLGTLGIQMGNETLEGSHPTMPDFPSFLGALGEAHRRGISHVAMEATSHGLHQGRLGDWEVDVALYTNLTQDHLDYHGTMTTYREAKEILFRRHVKHGGTAVINTDAEHWDAFCEAAAHPGKNCIAFGTGAARADFFARFGKRFRTARFFTLSQRLTHVNGIQGIWTLQTDKGAQTHANYSCPLVGDFQHENLAAASAALLALGYPLAQIAQAAGAVKGIPGRLERVRAAHPRGAATGRQDLPTVIVDYAHSPDALDKALRACRHILSKQGRLICVFGCGGDRDPTKRPSMGRIAEESADAVVVTSDNPRTEAPDKIIADVLAGMGDRSKVTIEADREKAITHAIMGASEADLVLIAGKGHEDYQIIGTRKFPFSDAAVSQRTLDRKAADGHA